MPFLSKALLAASLAGAGGVGWYQTHKPEEYLVDTCAKNERTGGDIVVDILLEKKDGQPHARVSAGASMDEVVVDTLGQRDEIIRYGHLRDSFPPAEAGAIEKAIADAGYTPGACPADNRPPHRPHTSRIFLPKF